MSDEQMIEESAARLFADAAADARLNERVEAGAFPDALWQQIESAGFPLALTGGPQGFGLTPGQALPIFAELGRHRLPVPLAETAIGLALLAGGGQPLPAGPGTLIDIGPGNALTLSVRGSASTVSGHVQAAPWARHARWAVAQLPDDALLAWIDLADAQGVQRHLHHDMAGLPADTLHFDRVPARIVRQPASAAAFAPALRTLGALVHAAMMAGAMQWALEQAIEYANDRVQFGRPIGKNQALQQALAQTAGDVASARMAVQAAGLDFSLGDPVRAARSAFGVAAAKIRCGEAATRTAAVAHQVLGAIGFTREHPLHTATRRLWAWREAYGADAWWAQRLGAAAIHAGATAFWPAMTARQFQSAAAQTGEPR